MSICNKCKIGDDRKVASWWTCAILVGLTLILSLHIWYQFHILEAEMYLKRSVFVYKNWEYNR